MLCLLNIQYSVVVSRIEVSLFFDSYRKVSLMAAKHSSEVQIHERNLRESFVLNATNLKKEIVSGNRSFVDAESSFAQLTCKELSGEPSPILHGEVIHNLLDSVDYLDHTGIPFAYLESVIKELGGIDCEKNRVSPNEVGTKLVAQQAISVGSWHEVNKILSDSNFIHAYEAVWERIKALQGSTGHLVAAFQRTTYLAQKGTVAKYLMRQRPINIAVDFAQLRTEWNKLYEITVTIELCATECAFHLNNYGPPLLHAPEV